VLPVNPERGRPDDPGDVAVIPVRDGADAAAQCAALAPGRPAVLLAGGTIDEETRRTLATRRALGVLSAGASLEQLRAAIAAVAAGLFVGDQPPGRAQPATAAALDVDPLTSREIEVLELLGKGLTNAELGEVLGISAHTAKFHVAQILAKLGAASRAEAVHAGLRLGLIGV
jgi:DNA-binding NarL/FixJ family response regulator